LLRETRETLASSRRWRLSWVRDPGSSQIRIQESGIIPHNVRQLIADLENHGFVNRGGKGSHRNFLHSNGVKITLSEVPGDGAKHIRSEISNVQFKRYSYEQEQTL